MELAKFYYKNEHLFCFAVYIIYLIYGLRKLVGLRDLVLDKAQFEFSDGWRMVGRQRDSSNDELENFWYFIGRMWPWYIVHTLVSALFRYFMPQRQSSGHAIITVAALMFSFRILFIGTLAALLSSYYYIASERSTKSVTWLLSAVWMVVINLIKNSNYFYRELEYSEYFLLIITLSWTLLRCCSFNLTRSHNKFDRDKYSLERFLGYTLYFPTFVYGPFLEFNRYCNEPIDNDLTYKQTHRKEFVQQCIHLGFELIRVLIWWCVLQFALHFLYIHYMARDVSAVKLVQPAFALHAVGYFMGQFFFLYYIITYGLGIAFARFDGLNPPNRPRCIGRIHFYSDMWKYFDEGLYEFLFKHIYSELCGRRSSLSHKLFATVATFAFVFVWHGCYTYVLIWSCLNFFCLVAEKCFKAAMASSTYRAMTQHMSAEGALRLRALLATQLFIPAAFSNVYFISGQEVGNYLMRSAYFSGFLNYVALTFCSYCFFQCSEFLFNVNKLKS